MAFKIKIPSWLGGEKNETQQDTKKFLGWDRDQVDAQAWADRVGGYIEPSKGGWAVYG